MVKVGEHIRRKIFQGLKRISDERPELFDVPPTPETDAAWDALERAAAAWARGNWTVGKPPDDLPVKRVFDRYEQALIRAYTMQLPLAASPTS